MVLVWLVCKVAGGPSRTPAPCQGRSPKPTPPPERGERVAFRTGLAFCWLFTGGAGRLRASGSEGQGSDGAVEGKADGVTGMSEVRNGRAGPEAL
eukprot:4873210-Prymnesium_polylepis.1